jgi:hypothetical protein
MLSYIEKFFPELVERIRRLPASIRVALAVLLALSGLVASRTPAVFAAGAPLLDQRYSVSGSLILLTVMAFLIVVPSSARPRNRAPMPLDSRCSSTPCASSTVLTSMLCRTRHTPHQSPQVTVGTTAQPCRRFLAISKHRPSQCVASGSEA